MPTDKRAKELSDDQISLLMQYWLDYDEDAIRGAYRERTARERTKPKYRTEDLEEMGYTKAEIEEMTRGQ